MLTTGTLEDPASTDEEVLDTLRHLSSLFVTKEALKETLIGEPCCDLAACYDKVEQLPERAPARPRPIGRPRGPLAMLLKATTSPQSHSCGWPLGSPSPPPPPGKTVNKLKKHANEEVVRISRNLVDKWRAEVSLKARSQHAEI